MICSFVSYYVKDHIFEIQREKCTYTVFMLLFSWNWHLKCHQDGDGPLQRDCETSGKTLVVGPPQAPPEGDAQQAALHLQTYSTCCHGKQSLEERVQLPQNHEAYHLFHPFSHTLWFPPCLFALAAAEVHPMHWRHLDAAKIYISETQQGVLYMSPAVPQGRQGG